MAEIQSSPGERDLAKLIAHMRPRLDPRHFAFAKIAAGTPLPPHLSPLMRFEESEGSTLILDLDKLRGLDLVTSFPCRMISLEIASSLEAVGFLAMITQVLARENIPVNPVSAYHHDHLFVPEDRANDAMRLLEQLSAAKR